MTLTDTAAALQVETALQLYHSWRGYYILQQLIVGMYCDVMRLSLAQAMVYPCGDDESLRLMWPGCRGWRA